MNRRAASTACSSSALRMTPNVSATECLPIQCAWAQNDAVCFFMFDAEEEQGDDANKQ